MSGDFAAFTGAAERGTLGDSRFGVGATSVYEMSFVYEHFEGWAGVSVGASGLQADIALDEGWTVDNFRVEMNDLAYVEPPVGVVPEPSTYVLMATGLLGVFGVARRRQ